MAMCVTARLFNGKMAQPVAGKAVLPEAVNRAREIQVWQITDGRVVTPEP
jgi:hypothetical protein